MAAMIAGTNIGVAPQASIIPIKGTQTGNMQTLNNIRGFAIMAGIACAAKDARVRRTRAGVINVSVAMLRGESLTRVVKMVLQDLTETCLNDNWHLGRQTVLNSLLSIRLVMKERTDVTSGSQLALDSSLPVM